MLGTSADGHDSVRVGSSDRHCGVCGSDVQGDSRRKGALAFSPAEACFSHVHTEFADSLPSVSSQPVQMVPQQPRRTISRSHFLLYLVLTVILAIIFSRATPRLSALLNHLGVRTSSSVGIPGPLRGILPLHSYSTVSQGNQDHIDHVSHCDKVSSFPPGSRPVSPFGHLISPSNT